MYHSFRSMITVDDFGNETFIGTPQWQYIMESQVLGTVESDYITIKFGA